MSEVRFLFWAPDPQENRAKLQPGSAPNPTECAVSQSQNGPGLAKCQAQIRDSRIPERIGQRLHRAPSGCLLWTGATNERGFGVVWFEGKRRKIHRVLWKLRTGKWPRSDREILHACDVRRCQEETHHRQGTTRQNARDRHAKGRTRGAVNSSAGRIQAPHTYKSVCQPRNVGGGR